MTSRLAPVAAATTAAGFAAVLALACNHSGKGQPLSTAGSTMDDGAGWLARASVKYYTSSDEGGFEPDPNQQPANVDLYNGYTYGGFGGDWYGAGGYGGSPYAGYQPYVSPVVPTRNYDYAISYGTDLGSIEGTVTWPKAPHPPATLSTGCDNPSLRLGSGNTVEGAVVYLEKLTTGKSWQFGPKPIGYGGTAEIRGCAIVPSVQVLGPLPDQLTIENGGDVPATMIVQKVGDASSAVTSKLESGRSLPVPVTTAGVYAVTDDAGKLAPAWIVIATHPYYTLSDDRGRFRLDDVSPGDYQLVVWQPPVITGVVDGVVKYGEPTVTKKKVTVKKLAETHADLVLP